MGPGQFLVEFVLGIASRKQRQALAIPCQDREFMVKPALRLELIAQRLAQLFEGGYEEDLADQFYVL